MCTVKREKCEKKGKSKPNGLSKEREKQELESTVQREDGRKISPTDTIIIEGAEKTRAHRYANNSRCASVREKNKSP
jgi:hypothetical protein